MMYWTHGFPTHPLSHRPGISSLDESKYCYALVVASKEMTIAYKWVGLVKIPFELARTTTTIHIVRVSDSRLPWIEVPISHCDQTGERLAWHLFVPYRILTVLPYTTGMLARAVQYMFADFPKLHEVDMDM